MRTTDARQARILADKANGREESDKLTKTVDRLLHRVEIAARKGWYAIKISEKQAKDAELEDKMKVLGFTFLPPRKVSDKTEMECYMSWSDRY